MKLQLLPSSFDENGSASCRQHLTCFVIDDCVAIDAGSLAMAASEKQRRQIRDIVLTHAHLDHIAGLALFLDDLFATLDRPICVYATAEVIEVLERDVFN
ncbi:MAG: MBL fold metallo-hydrolase, partial [Acidobacteria bacterium]|nr:MBL fold metallo-hydrolase [Acidobacteriota bacterium]MCA1609218.1 MBL fold metallo-hydrolase [Acidobacteriota bacterium]